MKKFEYYKLYGIYASSEEQELNAFGQEGWELVSVVMYDDGDKVFFLKREIE